MKTRYYWRHPCYLDRRSEYLHLYILDNPCRINSTEKPHHTFVKAVDKHVTYLITLTVEPPHKWAFRSPNRLPALSLIGCATRELSITSSDGIEAVHQKVMAAQIISDGIKVTPTPYF